MSDIDRPSQQIIENPSLRRAWLIYRLTCLGTSVAAVGRSVGVARQTIYIVFKRPYPRMEKALADAVGMKPAELFPERYDKHGLPNRPMGRPKRKSTTKSGTFNGNAKEAS